MNFTAEAFERRLATRADDAAARFDELDAKARAAAVTKVLRNHPAFATTFSVNDDCEIEQAHHPEIVEEVRVERTLRLSRNEFFLTA